LRWIGSCENGQKQIYQQYFHTGSADKLNTVDIVFGGSGYQEAMA
jgi:hypothetical protein